MLPPIPSRILKHNITLRVCSGVDVWQNPQWTSYQIANTVMQPTHETRKNVNNTEVMLQGLCFIDARRSSPSGLDIQALQQASEANGQPMTLVFGGNSYTVLAVDTLYDDEGNLHHWEVGLT